MNSFWEEILLVVVLFYQIAIILTVLAFVMFCVHGVHMNWEKFRPLLPYFIITVVVIMSVYLARVEWNPPIPLKDNVALAKKLNPIARLSTLRKK
jgi:hypothetical protein